MTEFAVTLDLHGVRDKAGLMDRCVDALNLPDGFGRNWDALADSLTDLSVWPEEAAGKDLWIVVRDWRTYARARPEEWETALDVFGGAVDLLPGLSVLLALGGCAEEGSDLPG